MVYSVVAIGIATFSRADPKYIVNSAERKPWSNVASVYNDHWYVSGYQSDNLTSITEEMDTDTLVLIWVDVCVMY